MAGGVGAAFLTEAAAGGDVQSLVGFQLRRAHTMFALHWQTWFRDRDPRVTPMGGGMLLSIARAPGLTQAALARVMDVEGPTLLEALGKLEAEGLVRRVRRLEDRRSYALHLTARGEEAVAAVRRFVPAREDDLLAGLSPAEREQLLGLLRRVVDRAHEVLDEAPAARPRRAGKADG